jgi:hypothetical protein
VSAALHRSLDGTKVTVYAQWPTPDDYERMRAYAAEGAQRIRLRAISPGDFRPDHRVPLYSTLAAMFARTSDKTGAYAWPCMECCDAEHPETVAALNRISGDY